MSDQPSIRLWPAWTILALFGIGQIVIWFGDINDGAIAVIGSMVLILLSLVLLTLWILGFSRLRGRHRLWIAGGLIGILLTAGSLFRIRGFTGDLIPLLDWRWSSWSAGTIISASEMQNARIGDSLQFLGPNRNAKIAGVELRDWTEHPPREIWRITVGEGWSGFAVSGNLALTQEQRGEEECVVAYDLPTGRQLWIHKDTTRYATALGGIGPRATPTIRGNRVYASGATGMLNCLDLRTGQLIWQRDFVKENDAKPMQWGNAGSPLLLGDAVIINAGGKNNRSLVAYHTETGALLWGGGTHKAGYSSPSLHRIAGVDQILIFNSRAVNAHDPANGNVLWSVPWPMSECVSQPLPLSDNRVFVSSGYGIGCKLIEITKDGNKLTPKIIWETPRMKAKFTNVIHHEGYVYGLDDGVLVCLDPTDGQRKWKRGRYGHGQILLVGHTLIVQTEDGDLVLVRPDPEKHIELARIPALDSRTWNNPTLAGALLLVRNDREAICFEVALEPASP